MSPDLWPIIGSALSAVGLVVTGLIGFIVKGSVVALRDLREDHEKVRDKVEQVWRLIEGKFITRDESDNLRDKLASRLDARMADLESRIRTLEHRADKP